MLKELLIGLVLVVAVTALELVDSRMDREEAAAAKASYCIMPGHSENYCAKE